MELHLHSHRWEARAPDWTVAAISGFVAGAVLMVLELLWTANVIGMTPWSVSHMVAAIVLGPDAMASADFSVRIVAVALVTHYLLGIAFGMLLAAIIAPFHLDSSWEMAMFTGAVFGLILYAFNFYGMTRMFPWFAELRGWPTALAHMVFGMVASTMYWQMERRDRIAR
jgi:uncharacterized membrane protein